MAPLGDEREARQEIDRLLEAAGWSVFDTHQANLFASRGVAIREFPLPGHGFADYLLYVDGKAAGVIEAKKKGVTLSGVVTQSEKYTKGLPQALPAWERPLPFAYESTGVETRFTNALDPTPRARPVFAFHQPQTLAAWLDVPAGTSSTTLGHSPSTLRHSGESRNPSVATATADTEGKYETGRTFLARMQQMPELIEDGLWPPQKTAIRNLEKSLSENRPRALIQMATGSGKTFTAISFIYRLIKFAGARRVLFLVDRGNLGDQTLKEFQQYQSPYNNYKFTEEYIVQRLTSNTLDTTARVCICTIQRMFSMLKGRDLAEDLEEVDVGAALAAIGQAPEPIEYNPKIPIETFDIIVTDECHRSIYNLWAQVLEYFDAYLIGLTATPGKQTFGFFHQNLVMEYNHEMAVADGVNVNYDVYRIRTKITEKGSKVESGYSVQIQERDSRKKRWEELDEDFAYDPNQLDRDVVAPDQIRKIIQTYRDKQAHTSYRKTPTYSTFVEDQSFQVLGEPIDFDAEEEPEEFFSRSVHEAISGTFVKLENLSFTNLNDGDGDWELEISPAQIEGEGIDSGATSDLDHSAEHDFLKTGSRGRQSAKLFVAQTGTRLSIDSGLCEAWATHVLAKGWVSNEDLEFLVAHCEGNGEPQELEINLQRILEVAGLTLVNHSIEYGGELWDARSDIDADDLAESIESALTRATRLPGTQRFRMDRSIELQMLKPLMQAKQDLQLGILASASAVEIILNVLKRIRDGLVDPASFSLRSITPSQPDETETAEFFAAADDLKHWYDNGRSMEGKRRREGLAALEALDLSLYFHKGLVTALEGLKHSLDDASRLDSLISIFEAATERLVLEHLPYARRFAARNVEENEDPEDVFQVAFTGLQRSTRRFDPERGYRFVIYCTFWMQQALARWRADEGSVIRIPVHRHEKLAKFDRAMDLLDVRANGAVSDDDLAAELEWATDKVRQFRRIPRVAEYPESAKAWDDLLLEQDEADFFDDVELEETLSSVLATLIPREEKVLRMRFGIGMMTDYTLEEVGQKFSVTRERIRQIEAKALRKLRRPSRSEILRPFLFGMLGEED